jgi:hypothetical protein
MEVRRIVLHGGGGVQAGTTNTIAGGLAPHAPLLVLAGVPGARPVT